MNQDQPPTKSLESNPEPIMEPINLDTHYIIVSMTNEGCPTIFYRTFEEARDSAQRLAIALPHEMFCIYGYSATVHIHAQLICGQFDIDKVRNLKRGLSHTK